MPEITWPPGKTQGYLYLSWWYDALSNFSWLSPRDEDFVLESLVLFGVAPIFEDILHISVSAEEPRFDLRGQRLQRPPALWKSNQPKTLKSSSFSQYYHQSLFVMRCNRNFTIGNFNKRDPGIFVLCAVNYSYCGTTEQRSCRYLAESGNKRWHNMLRGERSL